MKSSKIFAELAAIRAAALEDLMATSDAQLRQEAIEDGEDLDVVAGQIKTAMREAAAAALRERLTQAKERMAPKLKVQPISIIRPSLEQIKQIVQNLFLTDQSFGLAFRDGKKQTDADWMSLYDDLVEMGAIKPDDNGH